MELHHSSEQEASEKVTKLFINKLLARSSKHGNRRRKPRLGAEQLRAASSRRLYSLTASLLTCWPALSSSASRPHSRKSVSLAARRLRLSACVSQPPGGTLSRHRTLVSVTCNHGRAPDSGGHDRPVSATR